MKQLLLFITLLAPLSAMAQVFNVKSVEKVALPSEGKVVAAISPDGSKLLLTDDAQRGLESYDLATGQAKTLTTAAGAGYDAAYTADGKTIVYRETSFTPLRMTALKSVNAETGESTELVPATRDLQGVRVKGATASIMNAGKHKAVALKAKQTKLEAVDAEVPVLGISNRQLIISDGSGSRILSPNGQQYSYIWPSISPDGQKILYYVGGIGAFVCDLNGENVKSLGVIRAPKWYDDNTVVGMLDKDDGLVIKSSSIIAKTLDGDSQTLTDASVIAQYPMPSSKGGKIAFSTPDGKAYIINVSK